LADPKTLRARAPRLTIYGPFAVFLIAAVGLRGPVKPVLNG